MKIDFGRTVDDYGTHRAGFPPSFYDALGGEGIAIAGRHAIDLGTGTGTLARGLAARGALVIGIDPSDTMLDEARRLARADALAIDFRRATAEETGLAAASADLVSAGQCWHWFDRPRAARECRRLLRPDGLLVIAHFDWIPLPGNVVEATEQLIRQHNPRWLLHGGSGLYGLWFADLAAAGFFDLRSRSFDEDVLYSHAAWRGRIRASAGVGASLSPAAVAVFDAAHAAMLAERFADEPLHVHHRVFFVTGRPPRH